MNRTINLINNKIIEMKKMLTKIFFGNISNSSTFLTLSSIYGVCLQEAMQVVTRTHKIMAATPMEMATTSRPISTIVVEESPAISRGSTTNSLSNLTTTGEPRTTPKDGTTTSRGLGPHRAEGTLTILSHILHLMKGKYLRGYKVIR